MSRFLNRPLSAFAALVCLATPATLHGQSYDFTRSWLQCTTGAANACAELIVRTASMEGGGSIVDIGMSNLQGSSPHDNMFSSILNSVKFAMSSPAGASTTSAFLDSEVAGGGSEPFSWKYDAMPNTLTLSAPAQNSVTTQGVSFQGWGYAGTGSHMGHFTGVFQFFLDFEFGSNTFVNTRHGIGGTNPDFWSQSNPAFATSHQVRRDGYSTSTHFYSCGFFSTCTDTRYHPFYAEQTVFVQHYNQTVYAASGHTPGGSMVWSSFLSPNAYDVRDFASASFLMYDTETGAALPCDGGTTNCVLHESSLIDNTPPPVVTPEPLTVILLGSGLAGVGAARRRRRPGV